MQVHRCLFFDACSSVLIHRFKLMKVNELINSEFMRVTRYMTQHTSNLLGAKPIEIDRHRAQAVDSTVKNFKLKSSWTVRKIWKHQNFLLKGKYRQQWGRLHWRPSRHCWAEGAWISNFKIRTLNSTAFQFANLPFQFRKPQTSKSINQKFGFQIRILMMKVLAARDDCRVAIH